MGLRARGRRLHNSLCIFGTPTRRRTCPRSPRKLRGARRFINTRRNWEGTDLMPIDPSIALSVRAPAPYDPLEQYAKYQQMRDLAYQRQYQREHNELAMRRLQLDYEKDLREQAQEQAFQRALPGLGADPSMAQAFALGPKGVAYWTKLQEATKAQREADTAALTQKEKGQTIAKNERDRQQAIREQIANAQFAVISEPDPEKRAALNDKTNAELIKRGVITLEQALPTPTDADAKQYYITTFGPKAWDEIEKQRAATAKTRKDVLRKDVERVAGIVSNQPTYDYFLSKVDKDDRQQFPATYDTKAQGLIDNYLMTAQQRAQLAQPTTQQQNYAAWLKLPPEQRSSFAEFMRTQQPVQPPALLPPSVEAQRIRMEAANQAGPLAVRNEARAQSIATRFEQTPTWKNYMSQTNDYSSMKLMMDG